MGRPLPSTSHRGSGGHRVVAMGSAIGGGGGGDYSRGDDDEDHVDIDNVDVDDVAHYCPSIVVVARRIDVVRGMEGGEGTMSLEEEDCCLPPPLTISLGSGPSADDRSYGAHCSEHSSVDHRHRHHDDHHHHHHHPPMPMPMPSTSSSSSSSCLRRRRRRRHHGGRRLEDEYVLLPNVLGKGANGTVRECVHAKTRIAYACKSICKNRISNANGGKRKDDNNVVVDDVRREIEILECLDHPNLIRLVDWYENNEYVHVITERYGGGELFDGILANTTEYGCYHEDVAKSIIHSLLHAISYLHDNDIVHRDIKPENVLLASSDDDGDVGNNVRLIDLGLSRKHGTDEPHMRRSVGTAYYMSPELLDGRYDRSTDVWSLGILSYILLCGYPPYRGDDDRMVFDSIRYGKLTFPYISWSDKGPMAKDFVRCLLRRDARARPTARQALAHPWFARGRVVGR